MQRCLFEPVWFWHDLYLAPSGTGVIIHWLVKSFFQNFNFKPKKKENLIFSEKNLQMQLKLESKTIKFIISYYKDSNWRIWYLIICN